MSWNTKHTANRRTAAPSSEPQSRTITRRIKSATSSHPTPLHPKFAHKEERLSESFVGPALARNRAQARRGELAVDLALSGSLGVHLRQPQLLIKWRFSSGNMTRARSGLHLHHTFGTRIISTSVGHNAWPMPSCRRRGRVLHNGAAARVEVAARGVGSVAGAARPCASTRPLPSPAPAAIAAVSTLALTPPCACLRARAFGRRYRGVRARESERVATGHGLGVPQVQRAHARAHACSCRAPAPNPAA